jgi:hypothetical protein
MLVVLPAAPAPAAGSLTHAAFAGGSGNVPSRFFHPDLNVLEPSRVASVHAVTKAIWRLLGMSRIDFLAAHAMTSS